MTECVTPSEAYVQPIRMQHVGQTAYCISSMPCPTISAGLPVADLTLGLAKCNLKFCWSPSQGHWTWIMTLRGWGLVQELAQTLLLVAWRVHLCLHTLVDSRTVDRGLEVEHMVILTVNQVTLMG
jgi:hypothetical protein